MTLDIRTYPSRDVMAAKVADLIADRARALIDARGMTRLAVPGGTTPGPMLSALGDKELDWDKVVITLTDERWVPVTSQRSNQNLLGETLFRGTAAAARFVPLYTGLPDPVLAMDAVCVGLEQTVLPLDIAVLGMGADMHTASLFPGAVGLDQALAPDAPPAVAIIAPCAAERRVTLSAPVLSRAERHVLLHGADKRAALDRAIKIAIPALAPICAVLNGAIVHYAD